VRTVTRSFLAISIACALFTPGGAAGAEAPRVGAPERRIKMQFRNRALSEVVDFVAKTTGVAFLYDDRLKGRVTVTGDALVTPDETFSILEATLSLQGMAVLPTPGGPFKIVKLASALSMAPWTKSEGESDTPITTMVHLRHARSNVVIATLQKLVGTSSLALEYPNTNALIFAGREGQVRRLLTMVRALDQEDFENLIIRNLRYADAARTANQLDFAINDFLAKRPALHVWSDERTNSVLILASPPVLAQAHTLLDEIDRPAVGSGDIRVVPIRHVDPETLVQELNALAMPVQRKFGDATPRTSSPLLGRAFHLVVDPPTRSLLMMSDPGTAKILLDIVDQLDRVVPRISVEVIVSEISTPSLYRLGFGAFVPLGSQDSDGTTGGGILIDPGGTLFQTGADGTTPFVGRATRTPLEVPVLKDGVPQTDANGNPITVPFARESAVVVAGETEVVSKILMRPSLLVTSGEQREVFVGSNIPIPVQSTNTGANDPLTTTQSIERQDIGITLRATPTLGIEGGVELELEVELRALTASVAGDVAAVGPTIQQRRITTKIRLRDGETMVAGGHTGITTAEGTRGVPWLKSIPIIGWLFRDELKISNNTTLVIAAQVRILRSRSEVLAESIRRRLGFERALARVDDLETEAPYAVLVTTQSNEQDARSIAQTLTSESQTAVVSSWEGLDQRRFDVYLTGYEHIEDAGAAAIRARVDGWTPEVVALPPR